MRLAALALFATAASAQPVLPDGPPLPEIMGLERSACETGDGAIAVPYDARLLPVPGVVLDGLVPAPMPNLCADAAPLAVGPASRLDRWLRERPPAYRFERPRSLGELRERFELPLDVPSDGRRWLRYQDPYTLDDRALPVPDPHDRLILVEPPDVPRAPRAPLDPSRLEFRLPVAPSGGGE